VEHEIVTMIGSIGCEAWAWNWNERENNFLKI